MPELDKKTQEAIAAVQNGTLAGSLKKNMRYTTMGIALGGAAGILVATFTGKPRMMYAIVGAAIGGATGRIIA